MNQLHLKVASLAATFLLTGCGHRPPGGPGILVDFPEKVLERRCDNNGVCKVKVYARVAPNGSCEVKPEVEDVRIGPGFKPKMHWKIDSIDQGHTHDYRFALVPAATPPVYGIAIPANDPTQDFDEPDYDGNGSGQKDITTFKWRNLHGRALPNAPFSYDLNVERSPRGQQIWSPCARVDPRMFNE